MSLITGLFDPFYAAASGGEWRQHAIIGSDYCRIVVHEAAEEVSALGNQFAEGGKDWRAVVIMVPEFRHTAYFDKGKREIIEELLRSKLVSPYQCTLYMLRDNRVLVLLKMPDTKSVADFCRHVGVVLRQEGDTRPPTMRMFDLSHKNPDFVTLCAEVRILYEKKTEAFVAKPELSAEQLTTFKLTPNQMVVRSVREGMHVLVVEDDPATNALLVQLINRTCKVSSAYDAVSAVAEYRHNVPDLVLLDIGLPDVNGLELLKKMVIADARSFVVMLTANAFKTNIETALKVGSKGFMAKPFNRERLGYYIDLATQHKLSVEK